MQRFLSALPVRDFLFQLDRAFVDAPLQILTGMPQLRVPVLDLRQHFVETVNQNADLVLRLFSRADGIIPGPGHHLRRPSQFQDRVRDGALQPAVA